MIEMRLTPSSDVDSVTASLMEELTQLWSGEPFNIQFMFESSDNLERDYCNLFYGHKRVRSDELKTDVGNVFQAYEVWLESTTDGQTKLQPTEQSTIDRKIKDSGQREVMETGSVRDTRTGKGRYDLIPQYLLDCLAQLYEQGAVKYGENNWTRGQPFSRFYDSAQRHQAAWRNGVVDEPHLVQAIWNLTAILYLEHEIEEGRMTPGIADMGSLVQSALTKKKE